MTPREMKLAAAVALLVVLWGGSWGWQRYSKWSQQVTNARMNAEANLQAAKLAQAQANEAAGHLSAWREKSLPGAVSVAQSKYRAWLVDKLEAAKLKIDDVAPTGGAQRNDAFRGLSYSIKAEGDLAAVIRFLDSFYRSDQLHKVSVLRLAPLPSGDELAVTLNVEALVVDGAENDRGLAEQESDRLKLASAEEYVDRITARHPFQVYTPPKPPAPVKVVEKPAPQPEKPKFDDSEHAYLTGVVQGSKGLQAWVNVRTTGDTFRFYAGDELKIGQLEGRVAAVHPRELVVETDGQVLAIRLGDTLRDGKKRDNAAGG